MKIKFLPSSDYTYNNLESPMPAKNFIPSWYKKIKNTKDLNIKSCIPFLESFSSGYIQTTWDDILVTIEDENVVIKTLGNVPIVDRRDVSNVPMDNSFYNIEFIWQRHWAVSLPKGYSGLLVHPLNHIDLPFYTLSGIVDFDMYHHSKVGNLPFYLKKDFVGIIPKGTPMFQIIPIKRDLWTSEKEKFNQIESDNRDKLRTSVFPGGYKKLFWQKKSFD